MAEGKGLDLAHPGGKEIIVAGGIAVVLGVIYLKLNANKTSAGGGGAGVPASGHGLGGVPGPQLQTFFPGGSSAAGNALTDSLFTTPATPSPGQGSITIPTITGINGNVPTIGGGGIGGRPPGPRIGQVDTPVRHAEQGSGGLIAGGPAQSTAGPATVDLSGTKLAGLFAPAQVAPAAPTTGLSGQWQGGSLFNTNVPPLAWADSVLRALRAPFTSANRQSLIAWALNEGGGGSYNPLNTTMGSQYPAFNSVGVRNFPNWNVGAAQTAATIENGNYPNILAGLQSGQGIGSNAAKDLLTWSGSGYAAISSTWQRAGAILAANIKAAQAAAAKAAAARAAAARKAAAARRPVARRRPVGRPTSRLSIPRLNYAFLNKIFGTPKPRPAPKPLTQSPHHQRFVGGY